VAVSKFLDSLNGAVNKFLIKFKLFIILPIELNFKFFMMIEPFDVDTILDDKINIIPIMILTIRMKQRIKVMINISLGVFFYCIMIINYLFYIYNHSKL